MQHQILVAQEERKFLWKKYTTSTHQGSTFAAAAAATANGRQRSLKFRQGLDAQFISTFSQRTTQRQQQQRQPVGSRPKGPGSSSPASARSPTRQPNRRPIRRQQIETFNTRAKVLRLLSLRRKEFCSFVLEEIAAETAALGGARSAGAAAVAAAIPTAAFGALAGEMALHSTLQKKNERLLFKYR